MRYCVGEDTLQRRHYAIRVSINVPVDFFAYFCSMRFTLFILFAAIFWIGCGSTQPVRVLEEGKTKAVFSLGGPIIQFGSAPIPVPYLTIGAMHGYSHDLTLTANAHLLSAALGDIGFDAGAALRLLKQDGAIPEVTAKAQMYLFDNIARGPNAPRLFPMISLNGSYLIGESSLFYAGIDNLFQLSKPAYILSPFIGTEFYISRRISGQIETKWMAANINTSHGILEGYAAIGGLGSIGFFLGLTYSF